MAQVEVERACALLEPWQVGVCTTRGTEAVVHTYRRWVTCRRTDPQHALAQLNTSNAFHAVERLAI